MKERTFQRVGNVFIRSVTHNAAVILLGMSFFSIENYTPSSLFYYSLLYEKIGDNFEYMIICTCLGKRIKFHNDHIRWPSP